MNHYFKNDDNLRSNKTQLRLFILEKELPFISDIGVFSNSKIDYGSYVFLKVLLKENKVKSLLDVGCGYGVLGITMKIFDMCETLDLVDINERAVSLTKENIDYYKLENTNCFVSDGFQLIEKKYDQIIINPPIRAGKKVIYKMFEDSKEHLNENGKLYIVIKKELGAPSAIKKLQELFKNVEVIKKDSGYFIIKSYN